MFQFRCFNLLSAGAFERPATSRHEIFWRLNIWLMAIVLLLALLLALIAPARAGNTTFLTDAKGQIVFPFSPPNRATGGPGTIDNTDIGQTTPGKGTFSQISMGAGLPTIASAACGTGTNGAVVAGSTNQSGSITIGAVATATCTISFSSARSPAPKACVISAENAAAAAAAAAVSLPSTTQFIITATALANTNWAFHCL